MDRLVTKVIFLIISFILSFESSYANDISIAADSWCPYNCLNYSAKQHGLLVDMLKEIFKERGDNVVYNEVPWSRALKDAKDGIYDAILGADKVDVPEFIFPGASLVVVHNYLYGKTSSNVFYKSTADLRRIRLGVIQNYSYSPKIDAYIEKMRGTSKLYIATGQRPLKKLIDLLMNRSLDAIIEDKNVFTDALVRRHVDPDDFKVLDDIGKFEIFLAFNPNNPNAKSNADFLSAKIPVFKQSKRWRDMIAEYGVEVEVL